MDILRLLVRGVTAQRPEHSHFLGGEQLPLEARMGGLFVGFLVALAVILCSGRTRATRLPTGPVAGLFGAFFVALALDGLNAVAFDRGLGALYPPDNGVRLATGLLAGLALGALAWPAVAGRLWRDATEAAPLDSLEELMVGLALLGLYFLAETGGAAVLLAPLALIGVAGVLASLTLANTYLAILAIGLRPVDSWAEAAPPLAFGLTLALVELLALAALRAWAEVELGVRW